MRRLILGGLAAAMLVGAVAQPAAANRRNRRRDRQERYAAERDLRRGGEPVWTYSDEPYDPRAAAREPRGYAGFRGGPDDQAVVQQGPGRVTQDDRKVYQDDRGVYQEPPVRVPDQKDVVQKEVVQKDVSQRDTSPREVIQKDVPPKDVIQQDVRQDSRPVEEEVYQKGKRSSGHRRRGSFVDAVVRFLR